MNSEHIYQRGDRVTVDGYEGIVFWVKGWERYREVDCYGDCSDWEHTGMLLVIMVGDDCEHVVEPFDCTPLPEDEEVCSCGQRGCGWHGG